MGDVISEAKKGMKGAIEHLKTELKNIRTSRANPAILDGVRVEAYGTQMKLVEVANITVPEPRMLLITPFDTQNIGPISKGIERANLGLQPIKEGNVVRIVIPPMDTEKRKEMVKLAHSKGEECKVSIRNVRRIANEDSRKQKADGEITEDLLKKREKEIQELTDQYCKEADELVKEKENEITTI
ncbi:MAG: ribosome recycling factor [Chlamydiales bacterium]